jgi:NAD(P)-dependent dehydrogenase (short-subunit alcohol dehydrogenase family)
MREENLVEDMHHPVLKPDLRLTKRYVDLKVLFLLLTFRCISTSHAFSLDGKKALVTGSSGGIGMGIAQALVDRGAQVVLHYNERKTEALEFQQVLGSQKCLGAVHCDFRGPPDTLYKFMNQVDTICGGELDILVNNAGVVTKLALEDDTDQLTCWHETLAVNLHAPNLLSKLFVKRWTSPFSDALLKSDTTNGVIINVSSIHGQRSNEYMGAYAASKAALDSLTRTMAIEYAPYKVRVNAIAPGVVPVERSQSAFSNPSTMKMWCDRLALQRVGTVPEIAQACIPLIENDWITGSIWQVDGGMMARANMPQRERPVPPS